MARPVPPKKVAEATGGEVYAFTPAKPYTDAGAREVDGAYVGLLEERNRFAF